MIVRARSEVGEVDLLFSFGTSRCRGVVAANRNSGFGPSDLDTLVHIYPLAHMDPRDPNQSFFKKLCFSFCNKYCVKATSPIMLML